MDNGKDDNNAVSFGIIGGPSIGNKCQKRDKKKITWAEVADAYLTDIILEKYKFWKERRKWIYFKKLERA